MIVAKRAVLLAALAGLVGAVGAAPPAVVDAVQAPAWVERGDKRLPLTPGLELTNRDRVVVGSGARAFLQLADGSTVKLGEGSELSVNALGRRDSGVFTAALDVAKGAFRLTTDALRKLQGARAINVRIGTVTAGIRGTDIWGRADAERDFICLLEGRITVTHPLGEAAELTEPNQYYGADKGQPPGPVGSVDRVQVAKWSLETELADGVGTQQRGGRWGLSLGARASEGEALDLFDRGRAAGYQFKIVPHRTSEGPYQYELRLGQILTEREARLLADRLARDLNVAAPTVLRR